MDKKGIFDEFLGAKTLFKNKEVLRPNYIPEELPHRREQVNHLASILVAALRGETPSNIFIYGKTGTGKTAVTKYVGDELNNKAGELTQEYEKKILQTTKDYVSDNQNGESRLLESAYNFLGFEKLFGDELASQIKIPVHYIYINCQHVDTQYRVLTHIANTFIKTWDDRLPLTGWPTDEVYNRLRQNIDEAGGVTTIILDEIDKLVQKSGDDILYNLTRINSDLNNAKANVIGISNDLKFTEFLDARVKSSLGEEELIFPPYDAEQLQDILKNRSQNAFYEKAINSSVIPLCSALAAQEHGDARRALDLLRVAAEIADRDNTNRVEEKHVKKALNKIEQDTVAEVIRTLPPQSKLILLCIVLNLENNLDKLTTGMVFDTYQELCRKLHMDILTQRRVTDLIAELDMLGIINARVVSFGRGGRTRLIELSVPIANIKEVLEETELMKPVINYKPVITQVVQSTLDLNRQQ
jgi:cell division control protein 6